MAKALLFNIPASGHVNPSLPVVKALIERGEEVVYVNSDDVREQVEASGARFVAYPPMDDLRELMAAAHGNLAKNMATLVRIAERLMPFVVDVIEREQPDYLIHDTLCSWAGMAAQKFDLPTVGLSSTFIVTPDNMPKMSPPSLVKMVGQMAREIPGYLLTANRIRRTYKVRPTSLIGAVMTLGEMNIVFTSRAFHPAAEKFGEDYVFVGGAIDIRPATAEFPLELLQDAPKVIYISLGTINNTNTDFYRDCFEAFAAYPAQVVMSVGKATDISALGPIPENFIVRNFVPQLEILQHADAFITHGGMNSVHEAMMNGVPMVVIPQQVEQSIVAGQVVRNGVGVGFGLNPPYGRINVEQLRQGIDTILNDAAYAQNARRMGDTLREAGGSQRAAEAVQAFVRSKRKNTT